MSKGSSNWFILISVVKTVIQVGEEYEVDPPKRGKLEILTPDVLAKASLKTESPVTEIVLRQKLISYLESWLAINPELRLGNICCSGHGEYTIADYSYRQNIIYISQVAVGVKRMEFVLAGDVGALLHVKIVTLKH